MNVPAFAEQIRAGAGAKFPSHANTLEFAQQLDASDPIHHLRDDFVLPTKASLKKRALDGKLPGGVPLSIGVNGNAALVTNGQNGSTSDDDASSAIYFCGNSLGVQPKVVRQYLNAQLETWASIGVHGHFTGLEDSPLVPWQDMAEDCAKKSAAIVGAHPAEVVVMNTLTANLHFLMASFYKPTEKRHKIILEWRPFPSDWYTIESQIQWHGLDPKTSMVPIQPDENLYISTELVLKTIDENAGETALILLPGIQYYTGQLFDIPRITAYARERGIVVGWDLAHAAGNVELKLHEWDVDFAAWCTYKYQNAGPGSIAGAFVHEKHGGVANDGSGHDGRPSYRPRLTGWYGGDKSVRFNMDNNFLPTVGAAGYQVSNPSAIDLASLSAALSVFGKTDMATLRSKSLVLTAYAEHLLDEIVKDDSTSSEPPFKILTPRNAMERGAQLSVLLRDGLLDKVTEALNEAGIVCDKRKPNVIRVAPVPLYCTFTDVWTFMDVLRRTVL